MTKLTRKLLLSIITVVLTVVALGTTTFAWFTLTNTAQVQEFEAEIIADSGIEVAVGDLGIADLNDLEWKTVITPDDIYAYFGGIDVDAMELLNHVTTVDGINFTTLGTTNKGAIVTGGYIEIPIHFRSNSADAIQWTDVAISGETVSWTVDTAFTNANGVPQAVNSSMNINPADAIRVAIQGEVSGDANHVVAYENPALGSNHVLVDGNYGTNEYAVGGATPADDSDVASNPSAYANGSYNYFFNKSSGEVPLWGIESVDVVDTLTALNNDVIAHLDGAHGREISQVYYGTIVIRVWLEGWDPDSFDAQLARQIGVSFRFLGITL